MAIAKGKGAAFLPSSLSEFKNDKYTNLGNPGQPNYDNLAKQNRKLSSHHLDKLILKR